MTDPSPSSPPGGLPAGKPANQDWQNCGGCGLWWPVDQAFAALGVAVDTECPGCRRAAPFAPAVATSRPAAIR